MGAREGVEGLFLTGERFYVGVGHRARGRDAQGSGGSDVSGAAAAWCPAHGPWVRRSEKSKSTTDLLPAARTQRAALDATAVWWQAWFSRYV
ncbi:hypothetical protein GCM10009646_01320 [Streptomyces aureus]